MDLELLGPEEVLSRGGVEWKAELVEAKAVQNEEVGKVVRTQEGVPNHAVISSVVPRQTATPSQGREQGVVGDTVVFSQSSSATVPAEILASDTINLNKDPTSAPLFPCPKIYLHVVVRKTGVPIPPPATSHLSQAEGVRGALFWLAERVFGPLAAAAVEDEEGETGESAPIHITLERLLFGGVPATAVSLALAMVGLLLLGWFGVRPLLDAMLPQTQKLGKED